jgi:CubicO group peptidase (beta-lactamase class C family)
MTRRRTHRRAAGPACVLAFVLTLAACGSTVTTTISPTTIPGTEAASTGSAATTPWPTEGWPRSTPEDQGIDSEQLAALFERIVESRYAIDSVTIIRHGAVVADAYAAPYESDSIHITYSCTKSVVSTLIGIAIDQGLIEGVDVPLLGLFPDVAVENVDARKEALTLENALTMSTGMDSQDSYLYRWRGLSTLRESDDWTSSALSFPMAADPGTRFDYSNTASYLLSSALQRATGVTAADYADLHLFGPLGITDYEWAESPEGVNIGWSDLSLTPHDMAKFGYLMLQQGEWNGTQLVSTGWVTAATTAHISAGTLADRYGYQWWVDDDGYFMALGYAGQYIVVLPKQDAVVVFTSDLPEDQFFVPRDLVDEIIIPAMESAGPLPENPDGEARLAEALAAMQVE